jgi:hypothetical protein
MGFFSSVRTFARHPLSLLNLSVDFAEKAQFANFRLFARNFPTHPVHTLSAK